MLLLFLTEKRVSSRSSVRKTGLEKQEQETELCCPACTFSTVDSEEMISHFTGHESKCRYQACSLLSNVFIVYEVLKS